MEGGVGGYNKVLEKDVIVIVLYLTCNSFISTSALLRAQQLIVIQLMIVESVSSHSLDLRGWKHARPSTLSNAEIIIA